MEGSRLGDPDTGSGGREGWAASAMLRGALLQTSDFTSAADGDYSGQLSVLADNAELPPSPPAGAARVLEVGRVHGARAMARAICLWSPSSHNVNPPLPSHSHSWLWSPTSLPAGLC